VSLYQYTHWNWYSFRRPRKDDRLSQPPGVLIQRPKPPGVLIQRPTELELRTLGSQAATLTTEPTPGSRRVLEAVVIDQFISTIADVDLQLRRGEQQLETIAQTARFADDFVLFGKSF